MVVVDSSVWIDHLHDGEPTLVGLLDRNEVATHELVIGELALGSLQRRSEVVTALRRLPRAAVTSHDEVMLLVETHRLWGRGIGIVDAHLMAATLVMSGTRLWTRDKRLRAAASAAGVPLLVA